MCGKYIFSHFCDFQTLDQWFPLKYAPVSTPSSYCIRCRVKKDTGASQWTKFTLCSGTAVYHLVSLCGTKKFCTASRDHFQCYNTVWYVPLDGSTQFSTSLKPSSSVAQHPPRGAGEKSGTWRLISSWLYNATFAPIVSKAGPHLLFSMEFIHFRSNPVSSF